MAKDLTESYVFRVRNFATVSIAEAEEVEARLVAAMLEAAGPWLAPVPVEVAASIGTSWVRGNPPGEALSPPILIAAPARCANLKRLG
jgi:hypothetical protein